MSPASTLPHSFDQIHCIGSATTQSYKYDCYLDAIDLLLERGIEATPTQISDAFRCAVPFVEVKCDTPATDLREYIVLLFGDNRETLLRRSKARRPVGELT